MVSGTDGRAARRGSGRRFKVLVAIVVVVMVAWTALWFAAASIFERELEKALAASADGGVVATCDGRSIAGFPFRIELRCREGLRVVAPDFAGSLGGLTAVGLVYDPDEAIVEVRSPARLERPVPVEAEWALAHASLAFDLGGRALGEVRAEIEELALSGPGLPNDVTADLAGLYLRASPERPGDADVALKLAGLVPVPDAPAVDVTARVLVEEGAGLLAGDPTALLARLAREGVVLDIDEIRASSQDAKVSVGGELTVRPDGLLDGDLSIAIAAPDGTLPYLDRLSPQLASAVRGILRNVLPFAPETRIGDTPARSVALAIRSGRVSAGIVPLGRIPPLVLAVPRD